VTTEDNIDNNDPNFKFKINGFGEKFQRDVENVDKFERNEIEGNLKKFFKLELVHLKSNPKFNIYEKMPICALAS
jgi:hypothetical protein